MNRLTLAAVAVTLSLAGCGSGDSDQTAAEPSAEPSPSPTLDAAFVQAMTSACADVQAAAHELQISSGSVEAHHEEAKRLIDQASAALDALSTPPDLSDLAVAKVTLESALSTYKVDLLTENLTMLREYPGKTPDLSPILQNYDAACVRGVGAPPITVG